MNTRWLIVAAPVAILACAAIASSDPDAAKPPPKSDQPKTDQPKADPSKPDTAAETSFPPTVAKKLYAKHDLRGKQAPKLEVEKWLTKSADAKSDDKSDPKAPDTTAKVILIDFWATWCPPCVRLVPELKTLQQTFKDDLVVIGITDEEKKDEGKVRDFIAKHDIKYAMAVDTSRKMKDAVGVEGIPHVLIIGTDNVVRWQGFPQSQEETLTEAVVKRIIDADKARRAKDKAEKKNAEPVPAAKK